MEEKKLNSLNIEGLGTYQGGQFDRVNISGKGRITGNLMCRSLDISGMSTIEGKVESDRIKASGMGKMEDQVTADEMDVSGSLECQGNVTAKELEIAGMFKAKQCLKVEKLYVTGMVTVEEDITGERIQCEGMLKSNGFLNCESLEISARGCSKLNEVGAANIKVWAGESYINGFIGRFLPDFLKENKVTANVIEGDNIEIESCEAKIVRGKNIKLGPKCKIGLVEYTGTCEVSPEAKVDEVKQV